MTYYRKLCDKSICSKSRYKQFKSITHKSHSGSVIGKYVILIPRFAEIDTILKK